MVQGCKYLCGEQIFNNGPFSLAEEGLTQSHGWKRTLDEVRLEKSEGYEPLDPSGTLAQRELFWGPRAQHSPPASTRQL